MSWITDGSTELSVQGNAVTCINTTNAGNPCNAMYKEDSPLTTGEAYWKIEFPQLKESVFVGMTNQDKFKKGWALKGILYGGPGNLSNGSAGLATQFGPGLDESGCVVGLLASHENGQLKMYVDVNGRSVGCCFDIPADCLPGGVYPVVSFTGNGSAKITKETPPSDRTRPVETHEGLTGPWKAASMTLNGAPHNSPVPELQGTMMWKGGQNDQYQINCKIFNNMNLTITKENGGWKAQGGPMTRMGGEMFLQWETPIVQMLTNPSSIELVNDELHFDGTNGMKSVWKRYSPYPETFTGNPFA